jgi:hypothetical protein
MKFRDFITALAERIGMHQIPVQTGASEIRYFLGHDAVHHHFITALVRDLYRKNQCSHLDAVIDPRLTMKTISLARNGLVQARDTDICRYRFVDTLYHEARALLIQAVNEEQTVSATQRNFTKAWPD